MLEMKNKKELPTGRQHQPRQARVAPLLLSNSHLPNPAHLPVVVRVINNIEKQYEGACPRTQDPVHAQSSASIRRSPSIEEISPVPVVAPQLVQVRFQPEPKQSLEWILENSSGLLSTRRVPNTIQDPERRQRSPSPATAKLLDYFDPPEPVNIAQIPIQRDPHLLSRFSDPLPDTFTNNSPRKARIPSLFSDTLSPPKPDLFQRFRMEDPTNGRFPNPRYQGGSSISSISSVSRYGQAGRFTGAFPNEEPYYAYGGPDVGRYERGYDEDETQTQRNSSQPRRYINRPGEYDESSNRVYRNPTSSSALNSNTQKRQF